MADRVACIRLILYHVTPSGPVLRSHIFHWDEGRQFISSASSAVRLVVHAPDTRCSYQASLSALVSTVDKRNSECGMVDTDKILSAVCGADPN